MFCKFIDLTSEWQWSEEGKGKIKREANFSFLQNYFDILQLPWSR